MKTQLFSDRVYEEIVCSRAGIFEPESPAIPLQQPKSKAAVKVNRVLMKIFNDTKLHEAVKLYGKCINFAAHDTKNKAYCGGYTGYSYLVLSPEKRMVLVRLETEFMADSIRDKELVSYPLFQTAGGIYYAQTKFRGDIGRQEQYTEGVLAANDIRFFEHGSNLIPRRALNSKQIMKSLEKALSSL